MLFPQRPSLATVPAGAGCVYAMRYPSHHSPKGRSVSPLLGANDRPYKTLRSCSSFYLADENRAVPASPTNLSLV